MASSSHSPYLPSTPNSRSLRSHPSTTPLVPPPEYLPNPSTTPLVPPPRSVFDSSIPPQSSPPQPFYSHMSYSREFRSRNKKDSNLALIARGIAERGYPQLKESDDLILNTEKVINELDASVILPGQWQAEYPPETKEGSIGSALGIPAAEACYVASFVLQLHHSPTSSRKRAVTAPQALLEWLNTYHNPFPDDFDNIHLFQPSPCANDSFWDVVYSSLLRGRLDRVIQLLNDAGWEHAVTALDDGSQRLGYNGMQLENTRDMILRCVGVLTSCPGVRQANWDIKSTEWTIFRQRVRSAVRELEAIAEADRDRDSTRENIFAQSARGKSSLSTASRKAESKIPWSIYQNLKVLYAQLQGLTDEILLVSQDWLEASIFLTVWWDGDDGRSSKKARQVDITPWIAYRERLLDVFALATSEPEDAVFSVDTLDLGQVGVACAMEGNIDGVLSVLRSLSLPIASAVTDIAALSDWLPQGRPRSRGLLEQGFDDDDLMVLSHNSGALRGDVDRDQLLAEYADRLSTRQTLRSSQGEVRQGWEVAASVLGRMGDHQLADEKITALFDRVDINSDSDAETILGLCTDLGLTEQAHRIAERYADGLADTTQRYGSMLTFYARAHATDKVKSVLTLLTSLCLVQSSAMPPQAAMDDILASLLSSNRSALSALARSDSQAAVLLAAQLSGYATLRKFYDLRDENLQRPLERLRQAAKVLLAIIASASDCIRGGLFDSTVQSIIPVDGLIVLLGEVLPFCGQGKRILTKAHIYTLLGVIEDFMACPARLRYNAETLFNTCNQSNDASNISSSTSGLTGSSYDLLSTSSTLLKDNPKPMQRAWDWRIGLDGLVAKDITAQSLLLVLRVALANELAKV